MRSLFRIIALLLWTAQTLPAANYGKVSGRVVDAQSGAPLIGVNLLLEGTAQGAVSDTEGRFIILQVSPGVYSLRCSMVGYESMRMENISVQTNRIATADFKLKQTLLDMKEVLVTASRPVVEKDMTATARTMDDAAIAVLPTTSVNDVLRIQPGTVSSGGLHLRGGRSGEVTYYMDGIPLVDPLFSEINSSEMINRDIISELQVISGTYSAEYGNAMSGIINITTKEGGAKLKADVNLKSSSPGLDENSKNFNRNVLRANVSGPLLSDKTNFFVSGSWDDRDSYLPWGYRRENSLFAKITDRHLHNIKLSLGVNLSAGQRKNYSHSFKYIPDLYWYEPRTQSQLLQLGFTHTLTPRLYYSLNLYYTQNHYDSGDFDYHRLTPAYQLDSHNEFYTYAMVTSYEEDQQATLGVKGEMLWQANHFNEIKAGFELRSHTIDRFYINAPYYDDRIVDDYNRKPEEAAAFVQDKINFSSIILSAGLRFDMTNPKSDYWPSPYDAFYNREQNYAKAETHTQLSPRLGISYPVSDRTVFHFGYGHYFQRPEYQFIYKSMADEAYKANMIMALRTGNGRFGNPNLKPEKTIAYEFGLSHDFLGQYLFNVSVYSKKIANLVGSRTFFAGSRADIWESYTVHINEDFAYNNGLEIQLRKMRGRHVNGEINYTYAIAEGSSSGPLERVGLEEANRQTLKFFPLEFDQRHTVNAYVTWQWGKQEGPRWLGLHWLEKMRASLIFQYGSGLAYSKGVRGATEPYEINNARLPEHWTLDLKVDREMQVGRFRLQPYLEIYNLTNRKNVVNVDAYTGRPDFSYGRTHEWAANPLNWDAPRIIYVGLELKY